MSLKWTDFMVAAQQLSGMACHLISQGCRIKDGLGFVFLKTETKLLRAHQLIPHHESCCSGWKSVPFPWAFTINLVRNMQQGFSQLHFPGSLTPCTSKTHFKKKISSESPLEGWEWGSACQCAQRVQRGDSLPDTFLRNISPLIRTGMLSGDLQETRNEQSSKLLYTITRRYLCSEAGAHLIKQPVCSLHKISEVQLVQPAVSAMPLRSCAPDD